MFVVHSRAMYIYIPIYIMYIHVQSLCTCIVYICTYIVYVLVSTNAAQNHGTNGWLGIIYVRVYIFLCEYMYLYTRFSGHHFSLRGVYNFYESFIIFLCCLHQKLKHFIGLQYSLFYFIIYKFVTMNRTPPIYRTNCYAKRRVEYIHFAVIYKCMSSALHTLFSKSRCFVQFHPNGVTVIQFLIPFQVF